MILSICRHWMEKNCIPWAKNYFEENLPKVTITDNEKIISVNSVSSLTGDCDVTQRKGKVKCLFELKIEFVAEIKGEDDVVEKVTIVLPEFEHDYDESDFKFQIKTSNLEHKSLLDKKLIPAVVESVFLKFQPELISTHEKDLKHNTD